MKNDPHPEFTEALLAAAHEAKTKFRYYAGYYVDMLHEQGGYATARQLIHKPEPSAGFARLYQLRALGLTTEAYVLLPQWSVLFHHDDLLAAYRRLEQYRFKFPPGSWNPDAAQPIDAPKLPDTPPASDLSEPPARIKTTIYRILRDTELAREVKRLHKWKCQICGGTILLPDGSQYAEAHHIQPLGGDHKGEDVSGNILCLCPNHHAECDLGIRPLALASLATADGHSVSPASIDYHNRHILRR